VSNEQPADKPKSDLEDVIAGRIRQWTEEQQMTFIAHTKVYADLAQAIADQRIDWGAFAHAIKPPPCG
jgi:hypothetical protein